MRRSDWGFLFGALVAAFLLTFTIASQAKVRQFPLHRPVVEEGVLVCLERAKAVELMQTLVASGERASSVLLESYMRANVCGHLPRVEITYKEQVYRGDYDGQPATVFEATVGKVTVYVPMLGWLPEPGV